MTPKILFILHLPPPVHGAAMMGKYLQQSTLINGTFEADYINLSTSKHLDEIGKGRMKKIFGFFQLQIKVVKALIRKDYDLCYMTLTAQGVGFYKDFFIVLLLKIFGKKIIYHFHNKGVAAHQHKTIPNLLYKFTFKKTKSILLSQFLYPDIEKYVSKEDVYYCPNGIPQTLQHTENEAMGLRHQPPFRILFLSNMMAEKGVWTLLDACKILKLQNEDFECHFIGAWSDVSEANFRDWIETNAMSGHVFAHGKKYGSEKDQYFKQANVFVFPTHYHNETFGLVNLEAMEYSLPVISTKEGGIPDVVLDGTTGFLVRKKDAVGLAEKIQFLIQNRSISEKMGEAGRKRFLNKFTLDKFEETITGILATSAQN